MILFQWVNKKWISNNIQSFIIKMIRLFKISIFYSLWFNFSIKKKEIIFWYDLT